MGKADAAKGRGGGKAHGLNAHLRQAADHGIKRVYRCAHAADHAVILLPDTRGKGIYILSGNQIARQHAAENLNGSFKFFRDHLVRAKRAQRCHLAHKAGARNDVQVGVEAAGFNNNGAHRRRVGNDDGEHTRPGDAQMLQHNGLRGVAVRNGFLVPIAGNGFRIHFEDGVTYAGFSGHMGQMFSADAKAHNNQVVIHGAGAFVVFGLGEHPFVALARNLVGNTRGHSHKAGGQHHGEHAYVKECLVGVHVEQPGRQTRCRKNKGKFAHLREREGGDDGRAQGIALHQHRRQGEQGFYDNEQHRQNNNGDKML